MSSGAEAELRADRRLPALASGDISENTGLDLVDERAEPLARAIGRAVLAAAALEKILLLVIAVSHVEREGLQEQLARELSDLERRPAGTLLARLRALGLADDVARRVEDVIARRNRVVHRLLEDAEVLVALETGTGMGQVIARVDRIASDCQALIEDLAPSAFASLEATVGATLPELQQALKSVDPGPIEDERVRTRLATVRALSSAHVLGQLFAPDR